MLKHKFKIQKQIKNEDDSSNSSREFTHRVLKSKLQFEICKRNKRRRAPRASSPRVRPKKNMKLHHPSIPDRQGPTDSVSPNHHGHRSRSHNDKSDKVWSNLWTPKSENSNPTSGHLKVQILIQPLDTKKNSKSNTTSGHLNEKF